MHNLIFDVDDYFDGYHMKKYQVDLVNYVDRVRGVRNKAWGPWRDISPEAWDFYRAADPDLFKKRNKIIHEQTIS